MSFLRSPFNPLIKPGDVIPTRPDFEVICAFNAGVARYRDEVILLLRIAERPQNRDPNIHLCHIYDPVNDKMVILEFAKEDPRCDFSDSRLVRTDAGLFLTSISHLRLARSHDGVHFEIEDKPALFPANIYENYGIEDPRITGLGGRYYINYSGISDIGITTCLASTEDFRSYQRHGVIFYPDNKDVEIFPEKIDGKYYALHRPSPSSLGRPEIWLAESPDLLCWGNHRHLMGLRDDCFDSGRIGGGAVPFRIDEGWLEIYHGADRNNRYCLGAVLLDAKAPWRVLARSRRPIAEPETEYEVNGFFGNVRFSCGALYEDGKVKIYYGAADTCMCYAEMPLAEILSSLV